MLYSIGLYIVNIYVAYVWVRVLLAPVAVQILSICLNLKNHALNIPYAMSAEVSVKQSVAAIKDTYKTYTLKRLLLIPKLTVYLSMFNQKPKLCLTILMRKSNN